MPVEGNSKTLSQKYLITTEIRGLEWYQVSHSNIGTLLGSVLGLDCLNDPQYRLQQNQPYLLPTGNKLTQIQNHRSYIYFHFTLFRSNLHVATALTYICQVPHVPISYTALPDIIQDLHINSITPEFFHND
jgi:hypothetical protein